MVVTKAGNELALRASSAVGATVDYTLQGTNYKNPFVPTSNGMINITGEFSIGFYSYINNSTDSNSFDAIIQIRGSSNGNHFKVFQRSSRIVFSFAGNGDFTDIYFDSTGAHNAYPLPICKRK